MRPPCFPARPVNGGRLELAPPRRGAWSAEPKLNGWRVLVHAPTRTAFNRHNQPLSIASEFATALGLLHGLWKADPALEWFDCEGLERRHGIGRGSLAVLDTLLPLNYSERRKVLVGALGEPPPLDTQPQAGTVWLVQSSPSEDSPSIYPIQSRSAHEEFCGWVKYRFLN